jgi:hypothetical protein
VRQIEPGRAHGVVRVVHGVLSGLGSGGGEENDHGED